MNISKVNKWNEEIKKQNQKLKEVSIFKDKEKLRLKIQILELKIKIERLN